MSGFFEALSEFLESDLAKSHGWVLLVAFILLLSIGWCVIGIISEKVIIPSKTLEANNIKQQNKELAQKLETSQKEIEKLKQENDELKQKLRHFRFREAAEEEEAFVPNKALKKFTE